MIKNSFNNLMAQRATKPDSTPSNIRYLFLNKFIGLSKGVFELVDVIFELSLRDAHFEVYF